MGYGLLAGDWGDFFDQWRSNRFIHVMGLDFCLLWLVFPALLGDDLARRDRPRHRPGRAIARGALLVPLLGATAYLTLRPPLEPLPQRPGSGEPEAIAPDPQP